MIRPLLFRFALPTLAGVVLAASASAQVISVDEALQVSNSSGRPILAVIGRKG